MITERRIKDLSIAFEALSRINGYAATELASQVEGILRKEIEFAGKRQDEQQPVEMTQTQVNRNIDDEIPF